MILVGCCCHGGGGMFQIAAIPEHSPNVAIFKSLPNVGVRKGESRG